MSSAHSDEYGLALHWAGVTVSTHAVLTYTDRSLCNILCWKSRSRVSTKEERNKNIYMNLETNQNEIDVYIYQFTGGVLAFFSWVICS